MNGCCNHGCKVAKKRESGFIGTNGMCHCLRNLDTATRVQVERIIQQFRSAEELLGDIDRASHSKGGIRRLMEAYYMKRDKNV